MSELERLIQEHCPNGVEYRKIGDVMDYEQPSKYIVNSTDYNDAFETPVLTAGQTFILGYTNETDGIYNASKEKPVIIFDDFTGAFKWVDFPFKVKSSAMKILTANEDIVSLRYIFHIMGKINFSSDEHKRLWISIYSELSIPVPPIEVQGEIVRILDNFTELTAELTTELTARKKQYGYYSSNLFPDIKDAKTEWVELGTIATVTKLAGFEFTKYVTYTNEGEIIALRGLNVKNGHLVLDDVKYIDGSNLEMLTRSKLRIGDMLFTYVGTVGQVALINENDKYYLAPNVALVRITDERFLPEYMMYYFLTDKFKSEQIAKLLQASSMQNIPMEKIRKFKLPLISIEKQRKIVDMLKRFDALCNDISAGLPAEIEARQKQYEYYRDKLLTFKEASE